ncbi:MAG: NAD(P)H-dependent oxidoreductase [Candidatus Omnitrophota bacterium]|nr:MAG: NAD(P)H-dependent oxidoreductase [Candidatus Omnitrophota bacterium]
MKKLLHIIATCRGKESRTLKVSDAFIKAFKLKHPECNIDELNLFDAKLPELTVKKLDGKYVLLGGGELAGELKEAWKDIEAHIERFLAADIYLISTPMWNFNIPYILKHYIDIIVQPKYLFRYTQKGPEGLAKNKKMIVITSRGGDYSENSPFHAYDLQEPYLRTIFGFTGITDITFVIAQPMDALGPEVAAQKIKEAEGRAVKVAQEI